MSKKLEFLRTIKAMIANPGLSYTFVRDALRAKDESLQPYNRRTHQWQR